MPGDLELTVQFQPRHIRAGIRALVVPQARLMGGAALIGVVLLTLAWTTKVGLLDALGVMGGAAAGGGGAGAVFALVVAPRRSARAMAKANPGIYRAPSRLTVSETGIHCAMPTTDARFSWATFSGWFEAAGATGLRIRGRIAAFVVPTSDLEPLQKADLHARLDVALGRS